LYVYLFAATIVLGRKWLLQRLENERMTLHQSYVILAIAIVVALTNFFGAYFAVREARRRSNPVRRAQ
jgi:hypothetical protein